MQLHRNFEWDPKKAALNVRNHSGVTFEDAARVLADPDGTANHVEVYDDRNSIVEDRYNTTGTDPADRSLILIVTWTDRSTATESVTRIISARLASPLERKRYAKEIGQR